MLVGKTSPTPSLSTNCPGIYFSSGSCCSIFRDEFNRRTYCKIWEKKKNLQEIGVFSSISLFSKSIFDAGVSEIILTIQERFVHHPS